MFSQQQISGIQLDIDVIHYFIHVDDRDQSINTELIKDVIKVRTELALKNFILGLKVKLDASQLSPNDNNKMMIRMSGVINNKIYKKDYADAAAFYEFIKKIPIETPEHNQGWGKKLRV